MDIDLFIARNAATWRRLDELSRKARNRLQRLTPDEVDELVSLYQRTSSHLSHARVAYRDPSLTMKLSTLVSQAGGVIYRGRGRPGAAVRDFFLWRFPAAVYQSGRHIAASAALLLLPGLILGAWLAVDDRALDVALPEEMREAYLEEDFEEYYSEDSAANFAGAVTVNNIRVGFLAFAGGILLCIPTALIMILNGGMLGAAAGAFASVGQLDKFFGLVTPHGLLELTAVVIAGASGLRMGWAVIAPGDRSRGRALGTEARRAVVVALGLVVAFVVAGFIEGFITGRGVDTWVRVTIGVVAEIAFVAWIVVQGREATRRGLTGEVGELDRGWDEVAAARERAWARA